MSSSRRSKADRHEEAGQPTESRGDEPVEESQRQRSLARILLVIGTVAAVLGVIVGAVAWIPGFWDNWILRNTDLSIAEMRATTKDDVPVTIEDPAGRKSETSPLVASALAIMLRNSGEEPALINRVKLSVDQVWAPGGCRGAGGVSYQVAYDFVLPGNIDSMTMPYVAEKEYQFQVEGKKLEGLLIPIGQERFGQGGWPLILAGTIELTQDNGDTLKTEPFVLMDGQWNDDIVRAANEARGDGSREDPSGPCIERNLGMLRAALERPGPKSPSIIDLLERVQSKKGGVPQPPRSSSADEPAADTWIAQLASQPSATPKADVDKQAQEIFVSTGLAVRVLPSSNFESLPPGYWTVYHAKGFKSGQEALDACRKAGRPAIDSCVARYLSHREVDREFVCYFSDPVDARRCSR